MQKTMHYIPTRHSLRLDALHTHEYFGPDLTNGKCTVAIFANEKHALRAVWSFGNWHEYSVNVGDHVTFQHTQTFARTEWRMVAIIDAGN